MKFFYVLGVEPLQCYLLFSFTFRHIEDQNNQIQADIKVLKDESNIAKTKALFAPPKGFPLKSLKNAFFQIITFKFSFEFTTFG